MNGLVRNTFFAVLALLLSACRNEDGEQAFVSAVEIADLGVQSISIQLGAQGSTLEAGTRSSAMAIATLEDTSQLDVSDKVKWSSSDSSLISVSSSGVLSAGNVDGSVTLMADWGDLNASELVFVSTASLNSLTFVSFPSSSSQCFPGRQLQVDGSYDDGRTSDVSGLITSWTSSDEAVGTVSSSGVLNALGDGSTQIGATYSGQTANATLSVSADISNLALSLAPSSDFDLEVGSTQTLSASISELGVDRDVSHIARFSSSTPANLSLSSNIATGVQVGTSNVDAACGTLTSASVQVTVTEQRTPIGVKISYNGSEGIARVDVADSPIQLRAHLEYSAGDDLEVTTSDDLDWSLSGTDSGADPTVDNDGNDKGEIRFSSIGEFEIKVRYDDETYIFDDTIDVVVE